MDISKFFSLDSNLSIALTKINISLDKNEYSTGEKVKGIFKLTHGEHFWERSEDAKIYLEATGVEKTEVIEKIPVDVIDQNTGQPVTDPNTGQPAKREEYVTRSQSFTFFKQSLSSQIRSLGTPSSDGYLRIDKGTKEAPFEFTLAGDGKLFESYDGDAIKILYDLTGLVDKKAILRIDARAEIPFKVLKKPQVEGQSNQVNITSQNNLMALRLEAEKDMFVRRDVIRGKVTLNNPSKTHIARLEVGMRSTEKVVVNGVYSETFGATHMQSLAGSWSSGDSRTFELKIPSQLAPTFQGINSEYRWELAARSDSAGNLPEDLFAVHGITIM
jgi:hypothetical protein